MKHRLISLRFEFLYLSRGVPMVLLPPATITTVTSLISILAGDIQVFVARSAIALFPPIPATGILPISPSAAAAACGVGHDFIILDVHVRLLPQQKSSSWIISQLNSRCANPSRYIIN